MVGFRTRCGVAGGLRHGVAQIGNVVGEVGGLAGAAFRVVFAQTDSWRYGNFDEGRTEAWMARFLVACLEGGRRFGELSALVGELLCHSEFGGFRHRAGRKKEIC